MLYDQTSSKLTNEVFRDLAYSADEELLISKKVTIPLNFREENLTRNIANRLPNRPGVYIIYKNTKPHYVGISESSLRKRFQSRMRFLHELAIGQRAFNRCFDNLKVRWAEFKPTRKQSTTYKDSVRSRDKGTVKRGRRLSVRSGLLKIAEQLLIERLRPSGNKHRVGLCFVGDANLVIEITGLKPVGKQKMSKSRPGCIA